MVSRISPTYYALHERNTDYLLEGHRFDDIPSNAVGLFADDNDAPLGHLGSSVQAYYYDITAKTDTAMNLVARDPKDVLPANYLGAIVSNDGSTVYWVNNSRPLP